jgi:hypothetical protein
MTKEELRKMGAVSETKDECDQFVKVYGRLYSVLGLEEDGAVPLLTYVLFDEEDAEESRFLKRMRRVRVKT